MQDQQLRAAEVEWDRLNAEPDWRAMAEANDNAVNAVNAIRLARRGWRETEAFDAQTDAMFQKLIDTLEQDAERWRD